MCKISGSTLTAPRVFRGFSIVMTMRQRVPGYTPKEMEWLCVVATKLCVQPGPMRAPPVVREAELQHKASTGTA